MSRHIFLVGLLTLSSVLAGVPLPNSVGPADATPPTADVGPDISGMPGHTYDAYFSRHIATVSDIEAMKQRVGIFEPGRNYNVILGGHGTGDAPPSEQVYDAMVGHMVIYEETGAQPLPNMPPIVDHSTSPYFPPIGNQQSQGSCTAWATSYYYNGYLQRKDNDWTNKTNQSMLMSAAWTYNKYNGGMDLGSSREDMANVIATAGNANLATMPYNAGDATSWGNEAAWRSAPSNRIEWDFDSTAERNTNIMKAWLADGDLVSMSMDADILLGSIGSEGILSSKEYVHGSSNHALTIVGYNDTMASDGDVGVFRIANSWGAGWGKSGYFWMTYDALSEVSDRNALRLRDLVDYEPELLAVVNSSNPSSRDAAITIGSSSGAFPDFQPIWDGDYYLSTVPNFPAFIAFDITDLKEDIGFYDMWFNMGSGRTKNGAIGNFSLEWYKDGYKTVAGNASLVVYSPDTPKTAPCRVRANITDVLIDVTTPVNGTWQYGQVTVSGKVPETLNRTVFVEDFESWVPTDWTAADLYKTGWSYNGWSPTMKKAHDAERSMWSAGSDATKVYMEDFNSGWTGWTTASLGPNNHPFTRTNTGYRGTRPYDYIAVANSTRGDGDNMTERLYMNTPVNVSCHANLSLEFYLDYEFNNASDEYATVEYSTMATYPTFTTLVNYSSDVLGYQTIDISSLDGNDGIYIGFTYHGTNDWYMAVDDVIITGNKTSYDPDTNAYLEKTLTSLAGWDGAVLSYDYWLECENTSDYMMSYYKTAAAPTVMVPLENLTGWGQQWNTSSFRLPKNATKVGVFFHSNATGNDEGAYIDDMRVTGVLDLDDVSYRVDGGTWTYGDNKANFSFIWNASASSEGQHNISLRANYSGVLTYGNVSFFVDKTPPSMTDPWNDEPLTTGDPTRMYINATDPRGIGTVRLQYISSGGTQGNVTITGHDNDTWSYPLTVPSDATTLKYRFWIEDGVGNGLYSIWIERPVTDNDPPTLGTDMTPSTASTGDTITFNTTAEDNIAIANLYVEYWAGTGTHTNVTIADIAAGHNITIGNIIEPIHYMFSAVDTSNNWATGTGKTITVSDLVLPFVKDTSAKGATTGDPFTISFEASDNIALSSISVEHWFEGGAHTDTPVSAGATGSVVVAVPHALDKLHYVIRVSDTSGNVNATLETVVPVKDNDAPELVADRTPSTAITGGTLKFDIEAKDNIAVASVAIEYTIEGLTGTAASGEAIPVPEASLAPITYTVRMTDTSGNSITVPARTVSVIDGIAPVLGNDTSSAEGTTGETLTFSIVASDNIGVTGVDVAYRFNEGKPTTATMKGTGPYALEVSVPLNTIGKLYVTFTARDAAGNMNATKERAINIRDNDPPTVQDTTVREVPEGTPIAFKATASDNIAVSKVSVTYWTGSLEQVTKEMTQASGTWSCELKASNGLVYYFITATDTSGNMAATGTLSVRIGSQGGADTTPPVVEIRSPKMHTEFPAGTAIVKVDWNAYDGESGLAAIEVTFDGGKVPVTGIIMTWTFTGLSKGIHTVTVTARDVAGNEGRAMVVFSIGEKIMDITKPNVKITGPTEGEAIESGDISVQWTGSDADSGIFGYYIKVDGQSALSIGNVSSYTINGLSEGRHTVTVKAVDMMGNEAEAKVAFTITSDTGPGRGGNGTSTTTLLGMPFMLLWLILAAAVIGGTIFWASRRKPKDDQRRIKEGED